MRPRPRQANLAVLPLSFPSMQYSVEHQSDALAEARSPVLARLLAPEDVQRGDYVTVLHYVHEFPSFFWSLDPVVHPCHEAVRVQFLATDAGVPLKVRTACLPFVLVKHPRGDSRVLDLRRCQLARLDASFAVMAWKACKHFRLTAPTER